MRTCNICGNWSCPHMPVNDAGQRMSDTINNVRVAEDWDDLKNAWMVFKLEDGTSDGILYQSRDDAINAKRNKADKYFYATMRNAIHGMTPREATQILAMMRTQSLRGRYNPVPDGPSDDPILSLTKEDFANELASTRVGLPMVLPGLHDAIRNLGL